MRFYVTFLICFFTIMFSMGLNADQVYEKIPFRYRNNISINLPSQNVITTSDTVIIEGKMNPNYKLVVNKHPVGIDKSGFFRQEISLDSYGKQFMVFNITTEKESFSVLKNIIKLRHPKNYNLSNKELAFINTEYVSDYQKNLEFNEKFTREQFAFFLNQLTTHDIQLMYVINDLYQSDVQFTKAIQGVVGKNILTLDKNGNFFPKSSVNLVVFSAGVSKALNLVPSTNEYSFLNSYKNKWFYEYLVIGFDKKLLTENDLSILSKPLDQASFYKYGVRLNSLAKAINNELTFDDSKNDQTRLSSNRFNDDEGLPGFNDQEIMNNKEVEVEIIALNRVNSFSNQVSLRIDPVQPIIFNWKKVSVDQDGYFELVLPKSVQNIQLTLKDEHINLSIIDVNNVEAELKEENFSIEELTDKPLVEASNESGGESITVSSPPQHEITQLKPYLDIQGHWIESIANQLKFESKLDNTTNFNPNKKVSRTDLAKYIYNIVEVEKKNEANIIFKDVNSSSKDMKYINAVVSNKLLKGVSKNLFMPNKKVTRLEAIVVASRILPETTDTQNVVLPYSDVTRYKWANSALKKAYHYKIISKSDKLYPKRLLTNAEVVSILYKASKI